MINFTKILTITISLSTIPTALGSQEVVSSRIGENIDDLQNATARSRYLKGGVRGSAVGINGSVGSTGRGSSRGRAYSNYSSSQNNSTNKYGPTSGSSSSGGAVAIGMAILAVVALIAVVTTCSQVSQASETGKGTAVACSSQYKSTTGSLVEENRSTMESFQVKLSEEATYLYTASYIESGKKCTSSAELHFCPSAYGTDGTSCIEWSISGKGADSYGGFTITEGCVSANGNAFWTEVGDNSKRRVVTSGQFQRADLESFKGSRAADYGVTAQYMTFQQVESYA